MLPPQNNTATWRFAETDTRGIDISGSPDFCTQAQQVLGEIMNLSPTGWHLLRALTSHILDPRPLQFTVTICPAGAPGNRCVAENYVNARAWLSQMMAQDSATIATMVAFMLRDTGMNAGQFAQELNQTPDYQLDGQPAFAVGPGARPITAFDVMAWIQQREHFPRPFTGINDLLLKNRLKIIFSQFLLMRPGLGTSCTIYWDMNRTTLQLSDGTVQPCPAWLGLVHELVRAYYNISGLQLDEVENDPLNPLLSMALGRCMFVGLGPWKDAEISENAIRRERGIPLRIMY